MSKAPTKAQRERWSELAERGCVICGAYDTEIHHATTGGGGRKDHDKVLPLCYDHHRGSHGIHTLGRKAWAKLYGTEQELLDKLALILDNGHIT